MSKNIINTILERRKIKKKQYLEKTLHETIAFNSYRLQQYIVYPNELENFIKEYDESYAIVRCGYTKQGDYEKYLAKYNVDKKLYEYHINLYKHTLDEYHNMEERIKETDEQEKINSIKRAILQLKNEGKLKI